jgi:hypothetical protein
MKSKANIFEIPSGTLGFIVVPTTLLGQLNFIVNLFTSSSTLFVGMIETYFTK